MSSVHVDISKQEMISNCLLLNVNKNIKLSPTMTFSSGHDWGKNTHTRARPVTGIVYW